MTDLDRGLINQVVTSNGGDGEIGSDSREGGLAWNPESQAHEDEIIRLLRSNAQFILRDLLGADEETASIPAHPNSVDGEYFLSLRSSDQY